MSVPGECAVAEVLAASRAGTRAGRLYLTDGSMPAYQEAHYPRDAPGEEWCGSAGAGRAGEGGCQAEMLWTDAAAAAVDEARGCCCCCCCVFRQPAPPKGVAGAAGLALR